MNNSSWTEYRLLLSRDPTDPDRSRQDYALVREHLLPILQRHAIRHTMLSSILVPGRGDDYLRLRVDAGTKTQEALRRDIDASRADLGVTDIRQTDWFPEDEALKNVEDTDANFVVGTPFPRAAAVVEGVWSDRPRDEIAKDLATAWILAGDWARAFIEGFQERPSETRLLTELIHLFINGLMYTRQEESTI